MKKLLLFHQTTEKQFRGKRYNAPQVIHLILHQVFITLFHCILLHGQNVLEHNLYAW